MPAARYWRIVGIETYAGGDLELSELHLYGASGRVDATATLTSTIAPTAGTLAALQDDNLGTTCSFAGVAVRASGFALVWDFGVGNTADAIGVRLGASANQSAFLACCTLQYSIDGAQWQWLAEFARYAWPGAGAYTLAPSQSYKSLIIAAAPLLYWRLDETTGTVAADASGSGNDGTYTSDAASFTTAGLVDNNRAIAFTGTNSQIGVTRSASPLNHTQAWTAVILAQPTAAPPIDACGVLWVLGGLAAPELNVLDAGAGRFRIRVTSSSAAQIAFVSSSSWAYGTKVLAIARYNGSVISLSVNGAAEGQASYSYGSPGGGLRLGFGVFGDSPKYYPLNGKLDEFSLHQSYLSDTQVQAISALAASGGAANDSTVFVAPTLHTADSAVQIAASTPVPAHSTNSAPRLQLARDVEVGGPGTIYGTTKTKGTPSNTPAKARVVLLHQRSKLPVRETWSDPITGAFAFTGIDTTQQFLTLAEDAAGNFRPVAASRLVPEVAP